MATGAEAVCVVCGEPAHNKCSACKLDTSSRHYCGKACQVKDWLTHKKACKDIQNANLEKKLTRVANIVQQGYYDFRKNTWDRRIVKVERLRNDDLVLHEADRIGGIYAKYFLQFPQNLVPDKRTGNALLCINVCNEPPAWMYNIIDGLAKGLHVKIEEVSVNLKPPPHKVILTYDDGKGDSNYPGYRHEIIRVTSTKTNKAWVMDISGAQYGIYQALWSWQEYQSRFMKHVNQIYPFGTNRAFLKKLGELPGSPSMTSGVVGKVADHLANKVNNDWQATSNFSLSQLVATDEGNFTKGKLELLRFMDNVVRTFVHINEFRDEYKDMVAYEWKHPGLSQWRIKEVSVAFLASVESSKTA
ncbi:hypothetical protein AG0111_0g7123 [Alternaria gaisen]|uniref:Uncharacterized protein n=1 Tax=Alternaria gaisen TaxID=167740 RepID=A0ACB6FJJ5_9PLEO|nr:hypothetical protein AG0111_0g7123 [Alternaria gaisen]